MGEPTPVCEKEIAPGEIDTKLTPQEVEKNPGAHVGRTVRWIGKVSKIREAGPARVFVVPVEGRPSLTGRTELEFRVGRHGKRQGPWDFDSSLVLAEYLYGGSLPGIHEDATLELTATLYGETCRKHPLFEDRRSCFPLFVVHDAKAPAKKTATRRRSAARRDVED